MILILMLDIIFLLFILDGYWTIILGHEWEVPSGGRNPIPPQYLGFYLLAFTFLEIPFIFLQHPHSPLHPLQSLLFSCNILILLYIPCNLWVQRKVRPSRMDHGKEKWSRHLD